MDKEDKIIYEFPVLYKGWDCDNTAWIMERTDGTRYLKKTSHLMPYEATIEGLEETLKGYTDVVEKTQIAIKLLRGHKGE